MRAVIVGAGRIGCGYLAPTLAAAGWEVLLAVRDDERARRIARAAGWDVLVTAPERELLRVGPVPAVTVGGEAFARAVASADVVCTAVGVGNVGSLAAPLARALARRPRGRPLDVWVVENGACAAPLAAAVRVHAGASLPHVGFAGGVATAVVARGDWTERRPLFVGDGPRRLALDARRLVRGGPLPAGVEATAAYEARLREKLFTFNAAHAICAYLGFLRGHRTIDEAVADGELRPMVAGCLLESRRALLGQYPVLGRDLHGPVAEAMRRFADPELADPVRRVARDPIRKLRPGDRLLGPVELIRRATGSVPCYFALAVAGALLYRDARDEQACALRERLAREGVRETLRGVCGLAPGDPFAGAVVERYRGVVFDGGVADLPAVRSPAGGSP